MLAAVLFTDIVRSTERATALGDSGWRDLLIRHHAVVRAELVRFGGREVDTAGDGFFVVFDVPASAVRCARAAIEALTPLGLEIRAGVHMGEVSLIGDKVGGDRRAHRSEGHGHRWCRRGDGLEHREGAGSGSGLVFSDRGSHMLKGFREPWHLFKLESTETARVGPGPAPVLPVASGSGDPGRMPLPARLRSERDRGRNQFVGRADELKFLVSRWKAASAGERQAVLVGG